MSQFHEGVARLSGQSWISSSFAAAGRAGVWGRIHFFSHMLIFPAPVHIPITAEARMEVAPEASPTLDEPPPIDQSTSKTGDIHWLG